LLALGLAHPCGCYKLPNVDAIQANEELDLVLISFDDLNSIDMIALQVNYLP